MWYSLVTVLLAMRLLPCASGEQSLKWHNFEKFYFSFSSQGMNWTSAQETCRKTGADLAIINSKAKYDAVLQRIGPPGSPEISYWIGLQRAPKNNSIWLWVDGSTLQYAEWGSGEPNNAGEEHCASLRSVRNWTWNDAACHRSTGFRFVCGREAFLNVTEQSSVQNEVVRGQSLPLKCPVSGFPEPNVTWCEGQECYSNASNFVTLQLYNVTRTGKRSYYCRADNGHENKTVHFEITVTDVPKKPSVKTYLSQDNPEGEIGDELMLVCGDSATPNITYRWLKGGVVLSDARETRIQLRSEQDFGEYECVKTNNVGNNSAKIEIFEIMSKKYKIPSYIWITIGVLLGLVLMLFLVVIVLTRKVCKKKAFAPKQNDLGQEEIPMERPEAVPEDLAGVYTDLLPRENNDKDYTEPNDTRPAYVNTAPRYPNKSRADSDCLYEPLQPSHDAKKVTSARSSPSYVNVNKNPFKYT